MGTAKVKSESHSAASVPLRMSQQSQQSQRTFDENAYGICNHSPANRKPNTLQQSTCANWTQCIQTRKDEGIARDTCGNLPAPKAQRVACAENQLGVRKESGVRS